MDVSVIICTHNRSASLGRTLSSFLQSTSDGLSWELLVVDNDSTDETKQVIESFITASKLAVRYIFEGKRGLSEARNHGLCEAQGEIIIFIDDDVIVSPTYLLEVKKAFDELDPMCVGGKVLLDENLTRPPWWDERCDGAVGKFDRGDSVIVAGRSDRALTGIGANMSFRRSAFEKYGLFRTDMGRKGADLTTGEDAEMFQRLRKRGELVIYYPGALVYHSPAQQRFSKPYLREFYYRLGEWNFMRDLDLPERTVMIFGVPRWRYRLLLHYLWNTLFNVVIGNRKEALWQELNLRLSLGYLAAARRRRPPSAAGFT
jgi:glycosyltransferase involved in cell wall biosynthesis